MPPPASSPGSPPSPSSMLCAPGFIEGLLQVKETLQKDLWREPNKGELAEATSMSGLSEKNTWTIKPVNDILDWLSANFGFQVNLCFKCLLFHLSFFFSLTYETCIGMLNAFRL
ncbi:hypothetical protein RchiOBHm_Chr2g0159861 [Rosa chinensis]|uniref:Uncharacterized protein n=1 Tax=Rosa chinensis TaxID=74649 RepID=A0A2P6S2E1_ROSCH|nr:hypothetical protein RchiOBHm_Chr2g0159861 [Rosa chinensis]